MLVSGPYTLDYYPWQNITMVAIRRGRLLPGQSSETEPGEPTRVILRAEDDRGNIAQDYRGTVFLKEDAGAESGLPASYTFTPADPGVHIFRELRYKTPEVYRIHAWDTALNARVEANPVRCSPAAQHLKIFWGDLHDHSIISKGEAFAAHAFEYARDVAGLDFFALTDHDYQMNGVRWKQNRDIATQLNDGQRFVTFCGYEWSGATRIGGNHNVISPFDDLPLFRSYSTSIPTVRSLRGRS